MRQVDHLQHPQPTQRGNQAGQRLRQQLSNLGWLPYGGAIFAVLVVVVALAGGLLLSTLGGYLGVTALLALPALLALALLFLLRQYVLLAGMTVVAAIFLDFYQLLGHPLHEPVVALALALAVVAFLFLIQSEETPWVPLRHLWFWAALLFVAALAIPRGGSLSQTVSYYVTILATGLAMYALGTQITRSWSDLRWLLTLLTLVAAFIALHSIVEGMTGKFLFATANQTNYLTAVAGFHLAGETVIRAGSFLINPDWNGLYLAMSLFPAAGLIFSARTRAWRIFAVVACGLLLLALLFTFTTASWLAAAVGFGCFFLLGVPKRYRAWTLFGLIVGGLVIGLVFLKEVRLLYAHATASSETTLRLGAWETALRIIRAYPLTGIGMGYNLYLDRAERFRVALQTQPLAHPHNSYLELAAFAGIPVMLAFLALLGVMGRDVVRAWRQAPLSQKPLYAGGIAALVVLTVNSFFINGWTLPPFVCLGWLLVGAITSHALEAERARTAQEELLAAAQKRNLPASQAQRGGLSGMLRLRGKAPPNTLTAGGEPAEKGAAIGATVGGRTPGRRATVKERDA